MLFAAGENVNIPDSISGERRHEMCRGSKDGDRRCPSHRDERKTALRNARRREIYQDKKKSEIAAATLVPDGIPLVRGEDFGSTYFQEKDGLGFARAKFKAAKNKIVSQELIDITEEVSGKGNVTAALSARAKPESGGFWTAPATSTEGGVKTSWTDWAHDASFRMAGASFVEVKPKKHAVIVRCDSLEDLSKICARWPGYPVDFEAMENAGVHGLSLSQRAINDAKRADFSSLYKGFSYWDVDSTLWFNPNGFEAKKKVAAAVYEPKARDDDDYPDYDDDYDESTDVMSPEEWADFNILAASNTES
jgi:hypothetical protein